MRRRPPRSTQSRSSAASDVYKRQDLNLALLYFERLLMLSEGELAALGETESVLSPEMIESVYGVRAHLHRHAGRTFLTFSPRSVGRRKERIHLVCGGGSGL